MEIRTEAEGDRAEISLLGDLVASSAEQLAKEISDLAEKGVKWVLLNLRGVGFMDSTGLNACMKADKRLAERDGRIVFLTPSETVSKVFRISGARQKLSIAETHEEGVKRLADRAAAE